MARRPLSRPHALTLVLAFVLLLLLAKNDSPSSRTLISYLSPPTPTSPICPTPWLDSTPPSTAPALECVAISTNHSDFAVSLCSFLGQCNAGYVQVAYLDHARCREVEARPAAREREQNDYIKSLGPHTIAVLFDGAERAGGEDKVQYMGDCVYRYPFRLNNGGRFSLRVILVYEDYKGLDSLDQDKWQPIINQAILPKPFLSPLASCPPSCKRYQFSDYSPSLAPRLCAQNELILGVWLPTFPALPYNSTDAIAALDPVVFGKFPAYDWVPRGCRLELTAMEGRRHWEERAECFGKSRKVLITGDSHSSWMRDGLLDMLGSGFEGVQFGEPHHYTKLNSGSTWEVGAVTVDYIQDVVLSNMRDHLLDVDSVYSQYDYIIFSAAQWLVHQPFHEYARHIDDLADKVSTFRTQRSPTKPRFIWFTSPAWPHRSDETVRSEQDTRTNARLYQMNRYASNAFRTHAGVEASTIENFEISVMFSHGKESLDNAHWFGGPVIAVMWKLVVHRLGLCKAVGLEDEISTLPSRSFLW